MSSSMGHVAWDTGSDSVFPYPIPHTAYCISSEGGV
jgi:hypothetical protein